MSSLTISYGLTLSSKNTIDSFLLALFCVLPTMQNGLCIIQANLAFCSKLIRGLAPLPMMGPKVWLLLSGTSSSGFVSKAFKMAGAAGVVSVKDGIPDEVGPGSICVFVSPTSRSDYQLAKQLASSGRTDAVVVVNGLTKVGRCLLIAPNVNLGNCTKFENKSNLHPLSFRIGPEEYE